MLRLFGHVEMMDEGRWPTNVKAAKKEGQQGKGRLRFCSLDMVKKGFSSQGGRLSGSNATRDKKDCV